METLHAHETELVAKNRTKLCKQYQNQLTHHLWGLRSHLVVLALLAALALALVASSTAFPCSRDPPRVRVAVMLGPGASGHKMHRQEHSPKRYCHRSIAASTNTNKERVNAEQKKASTSSVPRVL